MKAPPVQIMYDSDSETSYNSEDEIRGSKRWIPVKLPANFDPNKVPTTGEEYLYYAIYEAKKHKSVITANLDTSKFTEAYFWEPVAEELPKSSKALLPTQAWQEQKLVDFTEFRDYLVPKLKPLPEGVNRQQLEWIKKINYIYPPQSVITRFNACTQLHFLEQMIKKLENIKAGQTIREKMAVWIYGILSVLPTPMSPSLCFIVRTLARQCALIRSKLPDNATPDQYMHLNLFICIIGLYFEQFDLADNSEE